MITNFKQATDYTIQVATQLRYFQHMLKTVTSDEKSLIKAQETHFKNIVSILDSIKIKVKVDAKDEDLYFFEIASLGSEPYNLFNYDISLVFYSELYDPFELYEYFEFVVRESQNFNLSKNELRKRIVDKLNKWVQEEELNELSFS